MRTAEIERTTKETRIRLQLTLDGRGTFEGATTVPFVDHMLALMSRHGFMDLTVNAEGDTEVDYHHLIEDLGIVLGQALAQALGDKTGIRRYGHAITPMDETLAEVTVDLSGRPYLVYRVDTDARIKDLDAGLFHDFFQAVSTHGGMNLHMELRYGRDAHHIIEALFKSFGRALAEAVGIDSRIEGVRSTKGVL